MIVCDASQSALRSGHTHSDALAAFDQDQVLLLISKENLHLHAKVFVFGNIAFIGAAMPRARAHQCFVADR